MLQNPRKTLGFKNNMVYKIPPGGGGKPYPASGLVKPGLNPPVKYLLTVSRRYFFVDLLCFFCLVFAMLLCVSVYMCFLVTC